MLHGSDVIVCTSSNRGTHIQRRRYKTCSRRGEYQGGGKGEGGGDGAGGNHHGTGPTGGSCRQRLLQMRAPVVMQDHVVWLPSGGPQLRVLLVSGAVRQCRAPDLEGQAASDARETRGRRGAEEGETATGAAKGGDEKRASRGYGEAIERRDEGQRPRTAGRSDATRATSYGGDSAGEGRCIRDGGTRGGRGSERRRAQVCPDPGGLTSPGGLRGLGSWEHGHASRRRRR